MSTQAAAVRVSALALLTSFAFTGCGQRDALELNAATETHVGAQMATTESDDERTDAPVFTPAPGTYIATQSVTMVSPTSGASVIYTIDGSDPSCAIPHGIIYKRAIKIAATTAA